MEGYVGELEQKDNDLWKINAKMEDLKHEKMFIKKAKTLTFSTNVCVYVNQFINIC